MRRNLFQKILIAAGSILLLAALVLFAVSNLQNKSDAADNERAAAYLSEHLPKRTPGLPESRADSRMPVYSYEETDYAAILTFVRSGITVPVADRWTTQRAGKMPCRFTGSAYNNTLVIGGTDDEGALSFVSLIDPGDELAVTDMRGREFVYIVDKVKHSKTAAASAVIDADYDLTVFAKDRKSGDWLLVRCHFRN